MERIRKNVIVMYLAIIIGTFCVTTIDCKAAIYVPDNDYNFLIYKDDLNEEDADYNVLFIGNSITFHPPCAYWWGSWGGWLHLNLVRIMFIWLLQC